MASASDWRRNRKRLAVQIRPMQRTDLPEVLEIERASFPSPWSKDAFVREICKNYYGHYLVAEHCGKVIGYAGMWLFLFEGHVTNIAVDPVHRGQKVGAALLLALMKKARSAGIKRMSLEVRVSNFKARRFYTEYGFEVRGLRRNYYRDTDEDAVVMKCSDIGGVLAEKKRGHRVGRCADESDSGSGNLL